MAKKIKEGSRVVIYRAPVKDFIFKDSAYDLKGRMDTVISIGKEEKRANLASGYHIGLQYLKCIVS